MLIRNDDGTYLAGPLDAIFILHHTQADRYHAAFFMERPFPDPVSPPHEVKIVRLVSQGHHTEGSDTLEGAQAHVDYFKSKIDVHGNVFRAAIPWDGTPGVLLLRENWLRDPSWRPEDPHSSRASDRSASISAARTPAGNRAEVKAGPSHADREDDARVRFSLLELD